jgi:hypothetical protein
MKKNEIDFEKLAKDIELPDNYLELILKNKSKFSLFELKSMYEKFKSHKGGDLILKKWKKEALKKAKKISSIHEANSVFDNSPKNSKAKKIALRKWRKYSYYEIITADSFSKAQQAFNSSPPGSKERSNAFIKWVHLASTCAEIKMIYEKSKNIPQRKLLVLRKWERLAREKEEIKELYLNAIGTKYELKALKKLSHNYED